MIFLKGRIDRLLACNVNIGRCSYEDELTLALSPHNARIPSENGGEVYTHVGLLKFHRRMSTDPLAQLHAERQHFKFKEQEESAPSQVIVKNHKPEFSCALFKGLVERKYLQRGARRIENLLSPLGDCFAISLNKTSDKN